MSEKLNAFIQKQEDTIKELKAEKKELETTVNEKQKRKRLENLGLYERDYLKNEGVKKGYPHYDYDKKSAYRNVPLDVSEETYKALESNEDTIKQLQEDIRHLKRISITGQTTTRSSSFAITALMIVAIITWLVGVLIGVIAAAEGEGTIGFVLIFSGFASGLLFYALAEVLNQIDSLKKK